MNSSTPKKILIVGGSLSGLMTGIVLKNLGHDVTILERATSEILKGQGAGIAIAPVIPPITAGLQSLGFSKGAPLLDFLQKYDRTKTQAAGFSDGFLYLKPDGTVRQKVELPLVVGSTSWDLLYVVLRTNFDGGYEQNYIAPVSKQSGDGKAEYFSGVRVTGLEDLGLKVRVTYLDSTSKELSTEVDLVVGADGPSSTIRKLLSPEDERKYAGYVGFRGTAKEASLSEEVQKMYQTKVVLYFAKGTQILGYLIPGSQGSLKPGERLANAVWYCNASEAEKNKLLTDFEGIKHTFSLGAGKIHPDIKASQLELANKILPPCFAEQWSKIEEPFIEAITDNLATNAVFMEGKVFLVGDALAGLRPHTTASTTQGAMNAMLLGKVFGEEKMSVEEWEKSVMGFAIMASKLGQSIGDLSQFGEHPMAIDQGDLTATWEKKG